MLRHRTLPALLLFPLLVAGACKSLYYDAMEMTGKEKRHLLAERVEDGREEQEEAKEDVRETWEVLKELAGTEPTELEAAYKKLSSRYEDSKGSAQGLRERIASIEEVAEDLFVEWRAELEEIQSEDLRERSGEQLERTEQRYTGMIAAMREPIARMDRVLASFQDHVLFLKHNLNAATIASLEGQLTDLDGEIEALIVDMEEAIAESDAFLAELG